MAFLTALAAFAVIYTVLAFRLDFLGQGGTLGPGFFPQIIGVTLVILLGVEGLLRRTAPGERLSASSSTPHATVRPSHGADARKIALLTIAFAAALPWAGALLSMAAFLLASLSVVHGKRWGVNLAVALLVPGLLFLLFGVWLGVPLPAGPLGQLP